MKVASKILGFTLGLLMVGSMFGGLQGIVYAAKFDIGTAVEVYNTGVDGLYVRDAPCGNVIGGKFDGEHGVVLDGPVFCDDYNRWLIRWSDDLEGWSAEDWLREISTESDLTVTSVNAPTSAEPGDYIAVSWTVKNQGDTPTGSFSNRISLATTPWGTDISLGNFPMSSISPGSSSSDTQVPKIPESVSPGYYYVTVYTDAFQTISESNENNNINKAPSQIHIGEETVSTPDTPSGPATGTAGTSYTYSTEGASSSLGHSLEYRFDWGDGSYSNWSSLASTSHSWTSPGAYIVRAQARCATHTSVVSGWSPGLTVNIPPPEEETTGTIDVTSDPSGASFTLSGPSNYSSTTPWIKTEAPVGNYTITWDSISGYTTALSETKHLTHGETIFFYGLYQATSLAESCHPYDNDYENTWTISEPGVTEIRIHFLKIELAFNDYIYILDKDNRELTHFCGTELTTTYVDTWTEWFAGDTLKVKLETNSSYTAYGFLVDKKETVQEIVSTPSAPSGTTTGTAGISYDYSTGGSTSSLGHSLEYRFDWGDGSYSGWSSSASASHSWPSGTYTVRAQARCATHTSVVSQWSGGKSVTINLPTTTPQITDVDPTQPEALPNRQWLGILGTGFSAQSEVILHTGTSEYPIPSERTQFVSTTRINVFVGLTDPGTWTAQVIKPVNCQSNIFSFIVRPQISEATAAIDNQLLDLIDQYASSSSYYNSAWDVSIDQYKAWIATLAWAEGGSGGYVAHSQGATGGDVFDHRAAGSNFRFSTGIGPFQLDNGGPDHWELWPTIDKLDPEKAVKSVLRWHHSNSIFETGTTLDDFAKNSPWLAINPNEGGNPAGHWNAVTGTNWDSHKNGKAELDWSSMKNQLVHNAADPSFSYQNNVSLKGTMRWSIKETEGVKTDTGKVVIFDGDYQTWLITARRWGGTELFKYYYTYNSDEKIEVWVWDDSQDPVNKFRYIFVREYSTGQFPENRQATSAGETVISPAIIEDTTLPTVNAFSVEPDSSTLGNAFTISYTVSDTSSSGLQQVELWRADDVVGTPDWDGPDNPIQIVPLSGNSYTGQFQDTPPASGAYWYGLHVVNNNNLWNDERNSNSGHLPGVYGPIRVDVTTPVETVSTPDTPSGPTTGTTGTSYSYSTGGASSSLEHSLEYRFDWGDGNYSGWLSSASASHFWSSGTYTVRAQARCATHTSVVSGWSPELTVNILPLEEDTTETIAESHHPYDNDYENTWTISEPGVTEIRIHFLKIELAFNDYIYILDKDNRELTHFCGTNLTTTYVDTWTEWFAGDTLKVKLETNSSYTAYGFLVDKKETVQEIVSTPSAPSGTTTGTAGISYDYSTGGSTSSLGHSLEYRFDWGDGSYSGWTSSARALHSWPSGTYTVRAQARCATHTSVISDWSTGKSVSMSPTTPTTPTTTPPTTPPTTTAPPTTPPPLPTTPPTPSLAESHHPYDNNYEHVWIISEPGVAEIRIHFLKIELAFNDYIYILDKDNRELTHYCGTNLTTTYVDTWTEWFAGDTLKIKLETNSSYTAYGFLMDKKETGVIAPTELSPTACIDSISPDKAGQGLLVSFSGHGTDPDGSVESYNWRSSIDGQLSTLSSFVKSDLLPGTHTIYFKTEDNDRLWSEEVSETVIIDPINHPYVQLYGQRTDVTVGEEVILELSIVNPITSPGTLTVQLTLCIPSGWSITSGGFGPVVGGIQTALYEIEPGPNTRTIGLHILANEPCTGEVTGNIDYCFAEEKEDTFHEETTLPVRAEAQSPTEPIPPGPTQIPDSEVDGIWMGWWVILAVVVLGGIATIVVVRSRKT